MTSSQLSASENYIRLLLNTTKEQAKILLSSATPKQFEAISEIVFNLLTLVLPHNVKLLVNRNKKFLQRIIKKTGTLKSKIKRLRLNAQKIMRILLSIKESIFQLL